MEEEVVEVLEATVVGVGGIGVDVIAGEEHVSGIISLMHREDRMSHTFTDPF